jgi:hypothetical protein
VRGRGAPVPAPARPYVCARVCACIRASNMPPQPPNRLSNFLTATANVRMDLSEEALERVVKGTDGYSGSDMKQLLQEACQV